MSCGWLGLARGLHIDDQLARSWWRPVSSFKRFWWLCWWREEGREKSTWCHWAMMVTGSRVNIQTLSGYYHNIIALTFKLNCNYPHGWWWHFDDRLENRFDWLWHSTSPASQSAWTNHLCCPIETRVEDRFEYGLHVTTQYHSKPAEQLCFNLISVKVNIWRQNENKRFIDWPK